MVDRAKRPPGEALVDLRRRLSLLPPRDPGRTEIIARAADAYGISIWTLYRALRELNRPKSVRRSDHGATRVAPQAEMERYAEIVAALKIRTTNKKGRHFSTARAIEFLETDGVETPEGLVSSFWAGGFCCQIELVAVRDLSSIMRLSPERYQVA